MSSHRFIAGLIALVAAAACGPSSEERARVDSLRADSAHPDSVRTDSIARAKQDSINRAQPGYVIDSVLPVEEELRRFRAAVGGTPATSLANGSPSREELVRRFVRDVAARDTADLRAMSLTAREFADLVYPTSPYTKPPYRQAPGLVWMQIMNPSASGFSRLLARRGGERFDYESHTCKSPPERQAKNLLWNDCQLRLRNAAGETTTQRWFGAIIERDGMFKIVSFSNQF